MELFSSRHQETILQILTQDVSASELLDKQREITNKALENKRYGPLWREFDESLVHVPHRERLFNTLDAAHFFNTRSISRVLLIVGF